MTGFGKSVISLTDKHISIEIKSLNSKSIDINTRIPLLYREKELDFRKLIAERLLRGKIDFSIFVENIGTQTPSKINENIVKSYIEQMRSIVDGDRVELLKMAVRMPDALQTSQDTISEEELEAIVQHIYLAVNELEKFRTQEGKVLEKDFILRIANINQYLQQVEALDSERLALIRERLEKAVAEIQNVDANRFEQELIFYLEKLDITEEKIRLKKHLDYFLETLHSEDSNGRKLGFISQEIGREINTLGSKANFAPMQQLVVQMKDELEKIKEQEYIKKMNKSQKKDTLAWEEVSCEHLIQDEWMDLRKSAYRFPDGNIFAPYYSYSRRDYVVVVASDCNGNYICVRQFRHGIKEVTTEFPAGGIDRRDAKEYDISCDIPKEWAFLAAKRELLEETGYESDEWEHLLTIPSDATICDNYGYLYRAKNCRKVSGQNLDETEFVEVITLSFDQIEDLIRKGKFQQAMHITAWLLAQRNK